MPKNQKRAAIAKQTQNPAWCVSTGLRGILEREEHSAAINVPSAHAEDRYLIETCV